MTESDSEQEVLRQWSRQHLDYVFSDITLLSQALTHRSVAQDDVEPTLEQETSTELGLHNERLEFLGDAVLDLAVSTLLYHRFPDSAEGELTYWRSSLVNTRALSLIGRELELGSWLRLGRGEVKSGGRDKTSILGNSVEAILGAVFLDGGWRGVETVTQRLFAARLEIYSVRGHGKDYKTLLQERLQGAGQVLPSYILEQVTGAPHERQFSVMCRVNERIFGRGEGWTKRRAEQEAAREALLAMDHASTDEE
ncbi:MAG: ribonuclease III [Magnetococcus sp. YQC-5]